MTPQLMEAARIIHAATRGHCNVDYLVGPANVRTRAQVMTALRGYKVPLSSSGINALLNEMVKQLAIPPACWAARTDAIRDFCRSAVQL